jgi:hypothetical protein
MSHRHHTRRRGDTERIPRAVKTTNINELTVKFPTAHRIAVEVAVKTTSQQSGVTVSTDLSNHRSTTRVA